MLVGMLLVVTCASTAQAAAYRYWTYWHVTDGVWTFAQAGPAGTTPADGSVEGWRFAISTTSGDAASQPSLDSAAAFEEICATTAPVAGRKRVALVMDPGLASDAPVGESPGPLTTYCTVMPPEANGYDVLRSVGPVRVDGGLICAIDKYPATGCADVVDEGETTAPPSTDAMSPAPAQPEDSQSSALPVIIGVGALALLGALAWRLRRRR